MKQILVFLIFCCAIQAQQKFNLLEKLPEKTLAVAWCPDVSKVKTAFFKSDMYQLYAEEEVQDFIAPLWKMFYSQINKRFSSNLRGLSRQIGVPLTIDSFLDSLTGEITIALVDLDSRNQQMPFRFAFSIELSAKARNLLGKVIGKTKVQKLGERNVHQGHFPGYFTYIGNTLLYASSIKLMSEIHNTKNRLINSEQFQTAHKKITYKNEVTSFACYLNIKQSWKVARQFIPSHVDKSLASVNLYDLESISFSSNFSGRNTHSHFFMHIPQGKKGIFSLFPEKRTNILESLRKIPEKALGFSCANFNLHTFMNKIEKIIHLLDPEKQMGLMQKYQGGLQFLKQNANVDLKEIANAIQGTIIGASLLPKEGIIPSSIGMYQIKNTESLRNLLQLIANSLKLKIKSSEREGQKFYYFSSPLGKLGNNPFDTSSSMKNPMMYARKNISYAFSGISYVIKNDYLYVSDSAQALLKYLKWQKKKGATLLDDQEFLNNVQTETLLSTNFMYLNQKTFIARWWNTALPFIRFAEGPLQKQKIPFVSALLPSHDTITKHLGSITLSSYNSNDGTCLTYKGQVEILMPAIVLTGVLIAKLIPVLQKYFVHSKH